MLRSRAAALAVLVVSVIFGVVLRLAPSLAHPPAQFLADGATIARLALDAAPRGRLPAVDSLAEAPAGRPLRPSLPPGLIVSAGVFQRVLASLGSRDAHFDLALFGALCGALIALPVFLWARAAFPGPVAAPAAAFLAVILPAHLHRTFGYLVRYDAPGSLAITAFLALVATAFVAPSPRDRRLLGAAAGVALVIAAWTWRVSLLAPPLVAAFVLLWVVVRGDAETMRDVLTPMVLVASVLLPRIGYLGAQRYVLSPAWLAILAATAALWTPPARSPRAFERGGTLVVALAAGVVAAWLFPFENPYASATNLGPIRLALLFGLPVRATPHEMLMLSVEELSAVTPPALLVGAMFLAWLGPWFALAAPLFGWLGGRTRPRPAAWRADHVFLAVTAIAWFVLSVMFYRTKVLLAPVAAVVVAGLLQRAAVRGFGRGTAKSAAAAPARGARGRRSATAARPGRGLGIAVSLGILVSAVATTAIAVQVTATRQSALDPDAAVVLDWLRTHRAHESPVAATWAEGFDLQAYARRATLTDGFLESPRSVRRVEEFARASLAQSPESLAAFCRRYGARQLVVPPSTQLLSVAMLTGDPLVAKLRNAQPLTPAEADRALVRMMVYGRDEPPFRKVFEQGLWRVYALPDSGS